MGVILDGQLRGKKGRMYVARTGSVIVAVLDSGDTYFTNCLAPTKAWVKCVSQAYWQNSIDWACGFSEHFTFGVVYDQNDKPFYPCARMLVSMTQYQMDKLAI